MYLKDKVLKITLRLSKRDLEIINEISKKMHKSKSEFIRFILRSYLAQIEPLIKK